MKQHRALRPEQSVDDEQLAFFDRLAALTRAPDASFEELRTLYDGDDRVLMPATVFNALLSRLEVVDLRPRAQSAKVE
jgi:hypothetical protein